MLSRADLLDLTGRFAGYLRDRVSPGDVVAIMVGNRAEYMIAHLAVCAVRATLVSINPTAKEHDTRHILSDSAAVLAIVDAENRALVEGLRGDCPMLGEVLSLDEEEPRGLTAYESERGAARPRPRRHASPMTSRTSTTRPARRGSRRAACSITAGGCAAWISSCG